MMVINGTNGDDTIIGTEDADQIDGRGGNDSIEGRGGNDTIDGGSGVDTIDGGDGDDVIVDNGDGDRSNDIVSGGDGYDIYRHLSSWQETYIRDTSIESYVEHAFDIGAGGVVNLFLVRRTDHSFNNPPPTISSFQLAQLTSGMERIELVFTDEEPPGPLGLPGGTVIVWTSNDRVVIPNLDGGTFTGPIFVHFGHGDDTLVAADSGNVIEAEGGVGNDTLSGGRAADLLRGDAGNDRLYGGLGIDTLIGGTGDDSYIMDDGDLIQEEANGGVDGVDTAMASYVLNHANVENLTYLGIGNFTGTGNSLANMIRGAAGNDSLFGLAGDDLLFGFGGNNLLDGGADVDTVSYAEAGSTVFVRLNGGATNNGQGGTDTIVNVENAIGTSFNDTMIGNGLANRLEGGLGADYLIGLAGNDVLVGGTGAANSLQGGTGDDLYVVSVAGDTLIEFAGEGTDTVQTGLASYTLRANFENLVYSGAGAFAGTGNELDNMITGGAGNDVLVGLGGNNSFVGGAGIDLVDYSRASGAVFANLNSGMASANGFGGADSFSGIENLLGSAQADTLIGNALANRLEGGAGGDYLAGMGGDDILIGGAGAPNTLQGGTGNDLYVVSLANDTLIEFANEGIDTVETSLNRYRLLDHFENLTFTGSGNFVGIGNFLGNAISGGSGIDLLNGGEGSDTLRGGGAADVFMFNTALGVNNIDTIEDFAPGIDEIRLDDFIFTALAPGALPAGAFATGASAAEADDRIIYNTGTGALLYDPDGIGGQAAIKFAQLDPGLTTLSAADFFVV
ncbi:MAG: calcium-binding protein [Sphingosinicella sp.]|uniref:calcium-binding protein n=1 Tax=Sphingosinicella sp. TaxID=1917971 RepID=UPI0040383EFF